MKQSGSTYVVLLLFVAHEEADNHGDSVDLMQELTLDISHACKVKQQTKVFCQILALRTSVLLQL